MKIHLLIGLCCVVGGIWLRIPALEWMAVILSMGLVLCAEMFNTVVEELSSTLCPERSETVRRLKDVSAGAVLMASFAALGVAFLVYPERILRRAAHWPLPERLADGIEWMVALVWGG